MRMKFTSVSSVALMAGALLLVNLSNRPDEIVIRDDEGVPRVVLGRRADGNWGLEVNGPEGKARVSLGYSDAANTTYAVFSTGAADRGVAISVKEESGIAYVHVGPRFKSGGEGESDDAIVLESRASDGLNSIGVYAGPAKPRVTIQSHESQSGLLISDDEYRPRAAFLRRMKEFGWVLWGGDGEIQARVKEGASGLEVDLDR